MKKKEALSQLIARSKKIISDDLTDEISKPKTEESDAKGFSFGKIFADDKDDYDILERGIMKEEENIKMENEKIDNEIDEIEPIELSTSNVAADVEVDGNIRIKGNFNFEGTINGNVECFNNLMVKGVINGDIKASHVNLKDSTVTGNIECESLCEVVGTTVVKGDIIANKVVVQGKVIGTINASEKIILSRSAILEGDCITSSIVIEEGATIKGNIQTK